MDKSFNIRCFLVEYHETCHMYFLHWGVWMVQWIRAGLPPLQPGFNCCTRRLTWVEFVVGFHLALRVFIRVLWFFSLSKTNTSKFQFALERLNHEPLARENGDHFLRFSTLNKLPLPCLDFTFYIQTQLKARV